MFRKCERGDGGGLLDLFEAQQQLILGKRFGPAAEPMTLHLLDDASPDGFSPPGPAQDVGMIGNRSVAIHVFNPPPDGGTSNTVYELIVPK